MHSFENDLTSCSFCVVCILLGYATLIRAYVDFLHSKLRYHSNHPEFNGTFDYNEYISLKGIDDPNEGYVLSLFHNCGRQKAGLRSVLKSHKPISLFLLPHRYETISDLMNLQDQIDQFQKLVFANFRPSSDNECRIAALVPLVQESYAIYQFATSMLRAMHRRTLHFPPLQTQRTTFSFWPAYLLHFSNRFQTPSQ